MGIKSFSEQHRWMVQRLPTGPAGQPTAVLSHRSEMMQIKKDKTASLTTDPFEVPALFLCSKSGQLSSGCVAQKHYRSQLFKHLQSIVSFVL